jgi:rubrerythrin
MLYDLIEVYMDIEETQDAFLSLRRLAEEIKYKGSRFGEDLLITIEEMAFENYLCPQCFTQLEQRIYKENRGEHFGFPAYEPMVEYYCPFCGWKDEE